MSKSKRLYIKVFIAILFGIIVIFSHFPANPAFAEVNLAPQPAVIQDSDCRPLDVIFLVDQSGSMSGYAGIPPADPNEQRQYAPQAMIDLLAELVLQKCPNTTHRVAVVSFGTTARIDVDLTSISPGTATEAQILKESLFENIVAENMGQTAHRQAFAQARAILNRRADISGEIPRRTIVIFLTDGLPCEPDYGCNVPGETMNYIAYANRLRSEIDDWFYFSDDLLAQENCIRDLIQYHDGFDAIPQNESADTPYNRTLAYCFNEFPVSNREIERSTYIYMLLLKYPEPYTRQLDEIYEDIMFRYGGELIRLSNNQEDLPATFVEILSRVGGLRIPIAECGNIVINPFLEKVSFVFYKFDEETEVSLRYTDDLGNSYTIKGGEIIGDGPNRPADNEVEHFPLRANERYTITYPYPGLWSLESDNCQRLNAYYYDVDFSSGSVSLGLPEIPQFDIPPYYDVNHPYYIEYAMRDNSGRVVSQRGPSRLHMELDVTVTTPTNEVQAYEMRWIEAESLFRSVEPLKVKDVGTYRIDIRGYTYVHEGGPTVRTDNIETIFSERKLIIEHDNISFTVLNVTPFNVVPITPLEGDVIQPLHGTLAESWPLSVKPLEVEVKIVNREGSDLTNVNEIFTNPNAALEVKLVSPAGAESGVSYLAPAQNQPGHFRGIVEGFAYDGEQTLVISVVGDLSRDYRPYDWETEVVITRTNGPQTAFAINPVDPVPDGVSAPIHGSILEGWPLPVLPLEVKVALTDRDGEPLQTISELLVNPNASLTARVVAPDGSESETVYLRQSAEAEHEFVGRISDFTKIGEQSLIVSFVGDYVSERYQPLNTTQRINFVRRDYLWTNTLFYYLMLIILILTAIFLIIYNIAIRKHKVRGQLVFELAQDQIEIPIFSDTNKKVLKKNLLGQYPQLALDKILVRSKPKSSRSSGGDEFFSSDLMGGSEDPGVSVTFYTSQGGTYSQDLVPNMSVSYSSDTDYQVRYEPNE